MSRGRTPASRHRTKPDPQAKAVGARVRQLRKEQDFSFDAFVEETGLGRGYISELERGLVVPTIHTLARLAAAFEGVTVPDLVLGDSLRDEIYEATRNLPERDLKVLLEQARRAQATRSEAEQN
ncbi:helix-turn-helix transcriptional regulator [Myxococcus sp. MxC21-1]|uniref:helix-turn-helix domain-containing protein n=1 Tax=Myxococcus sp. MxC21-1 TaxID=3041439 RepID=UPI0029315534|nr:helix-turn-helix transcriptional regulator [Myxococcus sp. MxC21-1]WNZ59112.1 helix-turn-helix transcriptional regulator [Myxococcus sp. MxC21-1]